MQNSITKSYRMMDELGWGGLGMYGIINVKREEGE